VTAGQGDASHRFLEQVASEGLFRDPGVALLAVSGGPDSIALLDLMHRTAPDLGLRLVVAHVDHGIAPDSASVAADVARWAARYDVPYCVERVHLGAAASETRARAARYRALRSVQRRVGARYLVTAHHRDDQAETVLLRALKGSGTAGLAGIPDAGPGGLTRPLLAFSRLELAGWLRGRYPDPGIGPSVHHDAANQDPRHDRSWLRHQLLPVLRARFGDAVGDRLLDLRRHAVRDRAAWAAALRAIPGLDLEVTGTSMSLSRRVLGGVPQPLAAALLQAAAREVGHVLSPTCGRRVLQCATGARSGAWVPAGRGWVAEVAFDRLVIQPARRGTEMFPVSIGQAAEGRIVWGGWELAWQTAAAEPPERASLVTWVTPGDGEIRSPRPGDRVRPLRGRGRRPVRRLLMEARVPRGERPDYPVLSRDGDIIWVPGVCRSETALPPVGQRALRWEARRVTATVGERGDPG